jgi:hypothetical protein
MATARTREASGRLRAKPPSANGLSRKSADGGAERPGEDERRPEQEDPVRSGPDVEGRQSGEGGGEEQGPAAEA